MSKQFETFKSDPGQHRLIDAPSANIEDGQVRLQLRQFALTANNITYAQAADLFGYWKFFPASDPDWGLMPVWGYGEVVESRCDGVPVGQLVYGYFPPASHLIARPGKVGAGGWRDQTAHRLDLPAAYNQYAVAQEMEPRRPLLEPLFVTSWCLAGYAESRAYFEAEQVVILSASGKTSLGLAHALKGQQNRPNLLRGLTSEVNLEFTQDTGVYDQVLTYEALEELDSEIPTLLIDMSGNTQVLDRLSGHFGSALKHAIKVGLSHWHGAKGLGKVMNDRSETFFAPGYLAEYRKTHGAETLQREIGAFLMSAYGASEAWFDLKRFKELDDLPEAYDQIRNGRQSPQEGLIFDLT